MKLVTVLKITAYLSLGLSVLPWAFWAVIYPQLVALSVGIVIAAAWPISAILALIFLIGAHRSNEYLREEKILAVSALLIVCVCSFLSGIQIKKYVQFDESGGQTAAIKTQNETQSPIIIAHNSKLNH